MRTWARYPTRTNIIGRLTEIFGAAHRTLRERAYCTVILQNLNANGGNIPIAWKFGLAMSETGLWDMKGRTHLVPREQETGDLRIPPCLRNQQLPPLLPDFPKKELVLIVISNDEHQQALQYAAVSINHTYDRMDYGDLPDADAIRFRHVYVGKAVEYAALRFLRAEYGLNLDPEPVETHYTEPDRADWVLTTRDGTRLTADMKSFHIFRRYQNDVRTCESIERRTWGVGSARTTEPPPEKPLYFCNASRRHHGDRQSDRIT